MRITIFVISLILLLFSCTQDKKTELPLNENAESGALTKAAIPKEAKVYEVGCGLCVFDSEMPDTCESYVKIDGKAFPITGIVLDAHNVGLCEFKGTAYLQGELKNGKFVSKFMEIKEFDKSKNYQE